MKRLLVSILFLLIYSGYSYGYVSDFPDGESCNGMETTKGCRIVKGGHWDMIDCNGYKAYYLPQACHDPYDKSENIYIDGHMYVWAYTIDGERLNSNFPCRKDYSCVNRCWEEMVVKYREEYDYNLGEKYCNETHCGLKPYVNDHCGCPEPELVSLKECSAYKKAIGLERLGGDDE